jgi:hypothetical protein
VELNAPGRRKIQAKAIIHEVDTTRGRFLDRRFHVGMFTSWIEIELTSNKFPAFRRWIWYHPDLGGQAGLF